MSHQQSAALQVNGERVVARNGAGETASGSEDVSSSIDFESAAATMKSVVSGETYFPMALDVMGDLSEFFLENPAQASYSSDFLHEDFGFAQSPGLPDDPVGRDENFNLSFQRDSYALTSGERMDEMGPNETPSLSTSSDHSSQVSVEQCVQIQDNSRKRKREQHDEEGPNPSVKSREAYHDTVCSSEESESGDQEVIQSPDELRDSAVLGGGDDELDDQDSEPDVSDFDNDDVDALLEEGDGYGATREGEKVDRAPLLISVEKHILVEKSSSHFEFLPNGWLKVMHQSGMPVYFHRETRICSLSRPYGLGKASLRGHKIPVSAIPCLEYRRAKDEEEMKVKTEPSSCPNSQVPGSFESYTAIHTADDHVQKSLLSAVALRDYCSKLFQFKCKTVHRYSSWKVGRGQLRIARKAKAGQNAANGGPSSSNKPGDPDDDETADDAATPITMIKSAKIITITRPSPDGKSQITFNLNPANKTPVSIFSEFIQHSRKLQPTYQFLELPDSNTPYQAVVLVDSKEEGRGVGASKKTAKSEAAKSGIMKLAPELKSIFDARDAGNQDDDIFADILIDDHRVAEIAHKSSHPAPYQLLITALQRLDAAHATTPQRPEFESRKKAHLKNVYTMRAGKFTATFTHQLHNFAKQMCAQMILKDIHPELKYYGDLLKLYGRQLDREKLKKKESQRAITDLQTKGKWGEPNWELLEKLKEVMKAVVPVPLQPGETSRIRY